MAIIINNAEATKKAAIEAAKAAAKAKNTPTAEDAVLMTFVPVSNALIKDKMRIVFDDSGSMAEHITDAKQGNIEYMRNVIPNTGAVSIHFLCTTSDESARLATLDTDLPAIAKRLEDIRLHLGSTPLFTKLLEVVKLDPTTRIIAFTDGAPTDSIIGEGVGSYSTLEWYKKNADVIIAVAISKRIPIDTVYFGGDYAENEIALLKYLAEKTGGYFLHFNPAKVNFSKAFKYLAPVNRKLLASASFRAELEAGKKE